MKKKNNLKIQAGFAMLVLSLGISLLVNMISIEDEPGALPLILIIVGVVWLVKIRFSIGQKRS
ncbi:MAG: hypothetical protein RQ735_00745 [Flavobacteriaceae bacterium]|nr:hypothetical protein [Flavobacteriaceae bacterium]